MADAQPTTAAPGAVPGAAATAAVAPPERQTGLVAAFTGPKEGVGKSSVCLNLALAWAATKNKPVLIVTLDPLCRNEHSYYLNVQSPTAVELAQFAMGVGTQTTGTLAKLLKGKITPSQWGVAVLPLAKRRADAAKLHPEALMPLLAALAETYDLFLDVDPFFPMQVMAFDMADIVFWVTLPHLGHLQATANTFQEVKELHFPLDRFEIVINQFDLPGAVEQKELERFVHALNRRIISYLPWEDFLLEHQNQQKILIVEKGQASDWVKQLRPLLGRLVEVKPQEKDWTLSVPASEFGWGGGSVGAPTGPVGGGGGGGGHAAPSAGGPSKAKDDWNDLKGRIHKKVVVAMETERIAIGADAAQNPELRKRIEAMIEDILNKEPALALGREQRTKFVIELIDEITGLGPLEEVLRTGTISEIMVNGWDHIYVEKAGKLTLTDWKFRDDEQLIQVIKRIVAPLNRRIDESVPLVDCRLKDGSRVNAIIPPLAVSGPTLTIRRFSSKPLRAEDMIKKGSVTADCIQYLKASVEIAKNIIVSGGTGTGKTTFLNMLSNFIPDGDRIISVEDTAELRLEKEHWVRLESRPANIEGKGEVPIRELVKNCLRMRPDRIVVGECRGGETLDMLQAMNTGHDGSLTTLHANAPREAVNRVEAMCLMSGTNLPAKALREMIASAVHMFVQLSRLPDGSRRVTYVSEITGIEKDGTINITDIFKFFQTGVNDEGMIEGEFRAMQYVPSFHVQFEQNGLDIPLSVYGLTAEQEAEWIQKRGKVIKAKRGH